MKKYTGLDSFFDLDSYLRILLILFCLCMFIDYDSSVERSECRARMSIGRDSWARSSAWLEHWSYTPGVGGSNPPVPKPFFAKKVYQKRFSLCEN